MFHLAAYFLATSAAGDNNLAGLVDPVLTRSATSNLYIFQEPQQLVAAVPISLTQTRVKLSSPTLRQINFPFLRPIVQSTLPTADRNPVWFADQPLRLPALEEIGPVTTITAAGPEPSFCLLWITRGLQPAPAGQPITVRATASTAAVANAWTLMSFTLDQSLPPGTYAVVGSECISTTGVAHRLAFPNQLVRPGSLSQNAIGNEQNWRFMSRRLGLYGSFLNTAPPLLEVLCTAADASHELYLTLVPTSGQLGSMSA